MKINQVPVRRTDHERGARHGQLDPLVLGVGASRGARPTLEEPWFELEPLVPGRLGWQGTCRAPNPPGAEPAALAQEGRDEAAGCFED